jgi:hypothetical protein
VTGRQFWLSFHLLLGVVFVHAFAGGFSMLLRPTAGPLGRWIRMASTSSVALVGWLTVISGTWVVYPWYRAAPPAGADVTPYPRSQLLADPNLAAWHTFAMEWKEHVGWLVPFLATAVAFIVIRYGHVVRSDPRLRRITLTLFTAAFAAAVVAGGLGALINNVASNSFLSH